MKFERSGWTFSESLARSIVTGLCLTDQWRLALSFSNNPRYNQPQMKNILARKAFSEGEIDLGFNILDEKGTIKIDQDVLGAYWTFCSRNSECFNQNVERMFSFFEMNDVTLRKTEMQELLKVINGRGSIGSFAQVNYG